MPYIGNEVGNRFVASKAASVYSGDGSTTAFTLEHAVGSDEDILVSVDGVIQEPSVAYAVSSGTTLTFTAAPSSNSGNNIFVYYLFRTVATVDHPSTSSLQATDGTFTAGITGTLQTAAQTNITSVGTLTNFRSTGIDDNADATSITIDSSENVMIGKTVANSTDAGFFFSGSGTGASFVREGSSTQPNLILNKKTNDGIIIDVRKDNTTVGNIGTFSSNLFIGSNDSGLRFEYAGLNAIVPFDVNSVASSDGATDLGYTNRRFKDLYLSSGLFVGGTGSANKLDDYEEGVVTVSLSPDTSGTLTLNSTYDNLAYTKVGRMVTLTGAIVVDGISSPVGTYVRVLGLPFTVGVFDGLSERSGFSVTFFDQSINDYIVEPAFLTGSVTEFRIYRPPNTWSASDSFYVNFSYFTA